MNRIVATALFALTLVASAQAGEVFLVRDAQGRPIYTDRPESLPASKVNVDTQQTDPVEVQARYQQQMQALNEADKASTEAAKKAAENKQASADTAADKAKRCREARAHYETVMTSQRLYVPGEAEGERQYLTSQEIDAAREKSKQLMDQFCAGL